MVDKFTSRKSASAPNRTDVLPVNFSGITKLFDNLNAVGNKIATDAVVEQQTKEAIEQQRANPNTFVGEKGGIFKNTASQAFNKAAKTQFLNIQKNKLVEEANRIANENPTDIEAFSNEFEKVVANSTSNAPADLNAAIFQQADATRLRFENQIQNNVAQIERQERRFETFDAYDGLIIKAVEAVQFNGASPKEVEGTLNDAAELLEASVETGDITALEAKRRFDETRAQLQLADGLRVIDNLLDRNDFDGAESFIESLRDGRSSPFGEMDQKTRLAIAQKLSADVRSTRAQFRTERAEAATDLERLINAKRFGIEVDANEERQVRNRASQFPKLQTEITNFDNRQSFVDDFRTQSITDQQKTMADLRSRIQGQSLTLTQAEQMTALLSDYNAVFKQKVDAYTGGQAVDFEIQAGNMSPINTQPDITRQESFDELFNKMRVAREKLGNGPETEEINMFNYTPVRRQIEAALANPSNTEQDRMAVMQQLRQLAERDGMTEDQFDKEMKELEINPSAARDLNSQNVTDRSVGTKIVRGQQLLKDNPNFARSENEVNDLITDQALRLFGARSAGRIGFDASDRDAIMKIMIANRAQGISDNTITSDDAFTEDEAEKAITEYLTGDANGELPEIAGNKVVPPFRGIDADSVENVWDRLTLNDFKLNGITLTDGQNELTQSQIANRLFFQVTDQSKGDILLQITDINGNVIFVEDQNGNTVELNWSKIISMTNNRSQNIDAEDTFSGTGGG